MIKISIWKDEKSAQFIFSGHANYAEKGKDIVCAGISTLTYLLANMVSSWADEKLLSIWMVWPDEGPHHIYVESKGNPAINAALNSIIAEFCQFGEQYRDNVNVQFLDGGAEETKEGDSNDTC